MITSLLSILAYYFIEKKKCFAYSLWLIVNLYYAIKIKELVFFIQALFCIYYLIKNVKNEQ
jgi:hypothetical protein